ncbi:MAG TPA: hypothetical protein VH187_05575 [Scandinavium sp.]|jgi:hypothetical protein|uniref:hypothetical protein n=1 Tax=Scandinavium sp. TaxID=2830653 RepID=UPI002E2EB8FD|nr:hypothetical protein [Scandinavium sp.]HEX4500631.1 hypothetical protein [Scandinavium sp.]
MGTVTVTSSGFAALPSTAPTHWSANITWPAGGSINGTKSFTISDADIQQMMSWIAQTYNAVLVGNSPPPVTVLAVQIFVAWFDGFMRTTTAGVQQQQTLPPQVPPPITIA